MFTASAPGSLMLLGEYGVLYGFPALVTSIDKRIQVQLIPRNDARIILHTALGHYETTLHALQMVPPFTFVLAVLKKYQKQLSGCEITIASEMDPSMGFGTSAAVTVATMQAIRHWLQMPDDADALIKQARTIIHRVQGIGSGADVAASVLGGFVAYKKQPFFAEKLLYTHPVVVKYCGYKTKTADAICTVQKNFLLQPKIFRKIITAIGTCAEDGIEAVRQQEWSTLGKIFNIQQGLMQALGVVTPELETLIKSLRASPEIFGAKISGSGLGDCVIGLGRQKDSLVQVASRGVVSE